MITVKTIVGFMLFRREAILQIASTQSARWLGLVFVLSAGFAREYDGEYLVAEPWHLVLPLAASIVGCIVLMLLLRVVAWFRQVRDVRTIVMFGALLNVYWMMAPMAWLYAIPFERFMDPGWATRSNLTLLGIVSVWRVTLMIRCVTVLYGASLLSATMPVMVFCLAMGYAALWLIPSPVFLIMGGIRLTESEDLILGMKMLLMAAGILTSPIWGIGYLIACSIKSPWKWQLLSDGDRNIPVSRMAWMVGLASLVIWAPILPWTQTEQRLRWKAERMLFSGSIEELCKLTREKSERHFPPHWDPPPRLSYGEKRPALLRTSAAIISYDPADWFWQRYVDKIERSTSGHSFHYSLQEFDDQEIIGLTKLLQSTDHFQFMSKSIHQTVQLQLDNETLSEERRDLLTKLKDACKTQVSPATPSSE